MDEEEARGEIEDLKRKRRKAEKEMLKHMDRRNQLNQEAKRWSGIRDEYNAKVRELLHQASAHKAQRDDANHDVREAKEVRHTYNIKVKELDQDIRALKRELLPRDAESLVKLKKEQRGLEFKQMTSVLSADKEKDLIGALSSVTLRIREIEKVVEENVEIRTMKEELIEAKEKAEEAHRKVSVLADAAQVEHDQMIELYSQIDELREVADNAQEKFVEAKTSADEEHGVYVTFLQQMKDYEKMVSGLWRKDRDDKKRTEEEKDKEAEEAVFDKLKKGEKLGTEDLMLLQKSG